MYSKYSYNPHKVGLFCSLLVGHHYLPSKNKLPNRVDSHEVVTTQNRNVPSLKQKYFMEFIQTI